MIRASKQKHKVRLHAITMSVAMLLIMTLTSIAAYAANNNPLTITVKQFFTTSSLTVADTFSYRLEPLNAGNPMPAGSTSEGYTFTVRGTDKGLLGPVSYNQEGVYRYKLYQVVGTPQAYYTYDRQVYTIDVYVSKEFNVNVVVYYANGDKADEIEFENKYYYNEGEKPPPVKPTDPDLMADLPVIKIVTGNPINNSTFTFRLVAWNTSYPMPAGSINGTKTLYIIGPGTYRFGTWSYNKEGTYIYTVYEENTGVNGYTYDTTVYTIVDTVSERDGRLVLSRAVTDNNNNRVASFTFTNRYNGGTIPPPVKPTEPGLMTDPPVRKIVTGNPSSNSTFTFKLVARSTSYPMPAGSINGTKTLYIIGSGTNYFGTWSYSSAGTYIYTVYEENTGITGYTYDTAVYTIIDTVFERDGQFVVSRVVRDNLNYQVTALTFTNRYNSGTTPPPVRPTDPYLMANPPIIKIVTGNPSSNSIFTFRLVAWNTSYPMPAGSVNGTKTLSIVGAGTSQFGTWSYDRAGIYVYTVYEENTGVNGYTYDTTVYTIADTVYENNGQLVVSRAVTDNNNNRTTSFTFTNRYNGGTTPPPTVNPSDPKLMLDPPVIKIVSGNPSNSNMFTFKLVALDVSYPMPAGSVNGTKTLNIVGTGRGEFGTWSYEKAGTYIYTVFEENTGITGYAYDTAVYTIIDTVYESSEQLVVSRVVSDNVNHQVSSLAFTNKYNLDKTEPPDPTKPTGPEGPKTGDESNTPLYIKLFALGGVVVILALLFLFFSTKNRKKKGDRNESS